MAGLHIDYISQQKLKLTGYIESSCSLVGWWSVHSIKTTILKREMLLEFMSCVSVTFIQKTYEKNSVSEITQCRQSLCHVCLQCIKGKNTGQKCSTIETAFTKKDIGNKPSKAPISNHIYCTLICDLQLLSTKLHCFYDSWMGHLNTILISQWDSWSVAKKTWELPKKCAGTGAMSMLNIYCAITRIIIYGQSYSA